jgi:hypothetical protein
MMVVTIKIGRRVPRTFFKGVAYRAAGFLTFQENIWLIISRALQMSKNMCDNKPEEQVQMTIQNKEENDGLHYKFQWKIVTISSIFPEKEKEEYDVFMTLYEKIGAIKSLLNKKIDANPEFSRTLKDSKVMTETQWEDAKKAGYGALKNKDIASKLLEMGIITYAEWKPDKDSPNIKDQR